MTEHLQIARDIVKVNHQISAERLDSLDITVTYDGFWQKRGFQSQNGVGITIKPNYNIRTLQLLLKVF